MQAKKDTRVGHCDWPEAERQDEAPVSGTWGKDSHSASREHLLTTEVGTKEEEHTHTRTQKLACQTVISVRVLLHFCSFSPDQTHSSHTICSLGQRKVSAELWGEEGELERGTSALWRDLKSNLLIAWENIWAAHPQTTNGVVSGKRLGEWKRQRRCRG